MQRQRVGILGATGLVGQRLIERLDGHPWFETSVLAASERSVGRPYREAVRWEAAGELPADVGERAIVGCDPSEFRDCALVFSSLAPDAAREIEPRFVEAGMAIVSNSSAFRMQPDVPLVVPEVNALHLALLDARRAVGQGFVVTNPNCSVIGLALALAPLHEAFGLSRVVVATLQAISGAGLNGTRALDVVDNVVPYIPREEDKLEQELAKILGTVAGGAIEPARIQVSAHCHRVGVSDGHLEAASVELVEKASPEDVIRVLTDYRGALAERTLPSAISAPIRVRTEPDRPQPRLDRDAGGGMQVVVGRVRPCPVLDLKLELVSHNAIRGAAGGTLLIAEVLKERGYLVRPGSLS